MRRSLARWQLPCVARRRSGRGFCNASTRSTGGGTGGKRGRGMFDGVGLWKKMRTRGSGADGHGRVGGEEELHVVLARG